MTRCEHSLKPTAHGEKPQGWRSIEPISDLPQILGIVILRLQPRL
jgi:hypothetical protein